MATGVQKIGEIAEEAVRRARWATLFLVVYVAVVAVTVATGDGSDYDIVSQGLAGLGCFVSSLRALTHGYRHGHREGRLVATAGLVVSTAFLGTLIVLTYMLRARDGSVSGITRSGR